MVKTFNPRRAQLYRYTQRDVATAFLKVEIFLNHQELMVLRKSIPLSNVRQRIRYVYWE